MDLKKEEQRLAHLQVLALRFVQLRERGPAAFESMHDTSIRSKEAKWHAAIGTLVLELHQATAMFVQQVPPARPEGTVTRARLVEIGDDEGTPVASFQLLGREDAMAISGLLYQPILLELRKGDWER